MNRYDKERTIIGWLKDYEAYKAGIENLQITVNDIAEGGMGVDYSSDNISGTNKFNSSTENAVLKMDKLELNQRIKKMQNKVNNIDRALESLTETEKKIINNIFILNNHYYEFCGDLCISERSAKRRKKEALRKMSIVIFGKD